MGECVRGRRGLARCGVLPGDAWARSERAHNYSIRHAFPGRHYYTTTGGREQGTVLMYRTELIKINSTFCPARTIYFRGLPHTAYPPGAPRYTNGQSLNDRASGERSLRSQSHGRHEHVQWGDVDVTYRYDVLFGFVTLP